MPLERIDKQPMRETILSTLASDGVGRHSDLMRMLKTLDDIKGPFSIFLDSAWGDGKTFLVRQLEFILRMSNGNIDFDITEEELELWNSLESKFPVERLYLPIYFNAWENDDYPDPLVPLLATIAESCAFADTGVTARTKDKIAALVDSITGFMGYPAGAANATSVFSGKDLLSEFASRRELRERFDILAEASLTEVANHVVIFIDELDRCEPRYAIKLLEQTKTLFSFGEVILVFSTNITQLAHAVRGLYGQSFDSEKYLERFYDMKVELQPIDSVQYLKYIGYDSADQHNFTFVANGFIKMMGPSMRDMNRLVEHMWQGQSNATRKVDFNTPADAPVLIAEGALLPAFISMSYERPDLWKRVSRGDDFSEVYDYAQRCPEFITVMDNLIGYWRESRERIAIDDELRRQIVEGICALAFIDDVYDERYNEAREGIGCNMWRTINKTLLRSLGMESN